ncbi:MAG: MFS transporter [Desulfotalea sp.]
MKKDNREAFALKNIRLFIAFRVLFNARFYYPVFTIVFLDYGLTIQQFALLNTIWAITIVCAEVPSGALADLIGRKKLLVLTSVSMIFELAIIAFVPLGNANLVFIAFLINRILSGLAEAMASGADEAIAYDSLVEKGLEKFWPDVLSLQMRARSIGTIISVTIGALIYDSSAMQKIFDFCGLEISVSQQITMRLPIIFTLVLAVMAFYCVSAIKEVGESRDINKFSTREAFKKTMQAGRWILSTPFALAIIIIAMSYDHVLRMIATMTSQYYRQIGLPDASFGIIGASAAVLGLFTPKLAEYCVKKYTPATNISITGIIGLLGLSGLCFFTIPFGLLSMVFIFTGLTLTSFLTSHYLNRITSSENRATVLSFKGLAFNLSYGAIGVAFAVLTTFLTAKNQTSTLSEKAISDLAFQEAISYFPWYMLAFSILLLFIFGRVIYRAKIEPEKD